MAIPQNQLTMPFGDPLSISNLTLSPEISNPTPFLSMSHLLLKLKRVVGRKDLIQFKMKMNLKWKMHLHPNITYFSIA